MNEEVVRKLLEELVAWEKVYSESVNDVSPSTVDQYHGILGWLWLQGKVNLPDFGIPPEKRRQMGNRISGIAGTTHRGPLYSYSPLYGCDREVFLEALRRAIKHIRALLPDQPTE